MLLANVLPLVIAEIQAVLLETLQSLAPGTLLIL